jgi:COX assembly protein 1
MNIHYVLCMPDSTNDSVLEEMKKAYMVEQETKEMKQ